MREDQAGATEHAQSGEDQAGATEHAQSGEDQAGTVPLDQAGEEVHVRVHSGRHRRHDAKLKVSPPSASDLARVPLTNGRVFGQEMAYSPSMMRIALPKVIVSTRRKLGVNYL